MPLNRTCPAPLPDFHHVVPSAIQIINNPQTCIRSKFLSQIQFGRQGRTRRWDDHSYSASCSDQGSARGRGALHPSTNPLSRALRVVPGPAPWQWWSHPVDWCLVACAACVAARPPLLRVPLAQLFPFFSPSLALDLQR